MKEVDKTGTASGLAKKLRQLGDIRRNPPRPIAHCYNAVTTLTERFGQNAPA
jgi:hypothetical protein